MSFSISTPIATYNFSGCQVKKFIEHVEAESISLKKNTMIENSNIQEIKSTATLILVNCNVGEVFAKNLYLIECSYKKASAEESTAVFPKIFEKKLQFKPIEKSKNFQIGLPDLKSFKFFHSTFTLPLTIDEKAEKVQFKDCTLKGDIVFKKSENSSIRHVVVLKGSTTFEGKVIGGTLIDKRKEIDPPEYYIAALFGERV